MALVITLVIFSFSYLETVYLNYIYVYHYVIFFPLTRKLLIQDINDLEYQQDEAKRALAGMSEDEEMSKKKEDPLMLRIALR